MDQKTYDLIHKVAVSRLRPAGSPPKGTIAGKTTIVHPGGAEEVIPAHPVSKPGQTEAAKAWLGSPAAKDWKEASDIDLDALVTPQIKQAIETHGLHALVARVYGVPEINEKTAVEIIGRGLMQRRVEYRDIFRGLQALKELE